MKTEIVACDCCSKDDYKKKINWIEVANGGDVAFLWFKGKGVSLRSKHFCSLKCLFETIETVMPSLS